MVCLVSDEVRWRKVQFFPRYTTKKLQFFSGFFKIVQLWYQEYKTILIGWGLSKPWNENEHIKCNWKKSENPKKQKGTQRSVNQLELVQSSPSQPLLDRSDLILTYLEISESGLSHTDGTIIHYTRPQIFSFFQRETIVQFKIKKNP